MVQLRQDYPEFTRRETEVLVISPEDSLTVAQYWQSNSLPFVGLPDPTHQVARLYGQQVKLLKLGRLPALIVIDKQGQIVHRHYGYSMSDIPDNREILNLLEVTVT